ncbi:MAG: AAA family ATPase [Crenarchaeota archaeon]|nr:AAA family ATPase [Thermoproteota archaeon]MDW8033468.1 AAA family ATPase [Nitrososphaerota archaeon]
MWKFLSLPPEKRRKIVNKKARKIRKTPHFPRVNKEDLIGRDEEFFKVMVSIHYHVFRDPEIRKTFTTPPPKLFVIKGSSGSGKTFFAEIVQRESFEKGLEYGLLVNLLKLRPEQVYSMWYGQSAQRLSEFFNNAFYSPSVVLIDEFQAFAKRFSSTTEVGMEETRVQTVLLEKFDELQKKDYRTIVLVSTTEYESLIDTLRRRGVAGTIDLDENISRSMLLKIVEKQCQAHKIKLPPNDILTVIEDTLRTFETQAITPADIVNAFQMVVNSKVAPLQKNIIDRLLHGESMVEQVNPGELVTLNDFREAASKVKAYSITTRTEAAKKSIVKLRPKERYEDVGGLKGVREEVIKEISLSLNPELASRARYIPPKGFLFYGPPGTGKTLLARAIAGENNVWFYLINGPSIIQGVYGDPEKTIRDIFEDARRNAPAIIFFDEIDSVAPMRGTHDPVMDRVTSQLLTELDGFIPLSGVVVIASTNRIEVLDRALLERFTRTFEFSYPKTDEEKKEIISIHLKKYLDVLSDETTVDSVLETLRKKALSPRRIADVINEANRLRVKEIDAARQLIKALEEGESVEEIRSIYSNDLERLSKILGVDEKSDEFLRKIRLVSPSNYPLRLIHFQQALESLSEEEAVSEARTMIERSVREETPEIGKSYGLVAIGVIGDQSGLVSAIEVVINPDGRGLVKTVGSEYGESIQASAEDAFIYINSISGWRFKNYDVFVELVTPAKGMEKLQLRPGVSYPPVSGPSAGLAIGVAMISAFTSLRVDPTVIMTGAITAKGEVWPVGGLDHRGMGKIDAALADKYARKLLVPKFNYESMKSLKIIDVLESKGISVEPVSNLLEAAVKSLIGVKSIEELLSHLKAERSIEQIKAAS